tara:strand:+ start:742 stop:1062 length:321 start_codon:yes stop_codon:yes gene_type:complete
MIFEALLELKPTCDFVVDGDKLIWNDKEELRPTDEEIALKVKELEAAQPLKELREERNDLLMETDYIMVSDYPHTNKQAWIKYRQDLRDLPQTADLSNVEYPIKPQ